MIIWTPKSQHETDGLIDWLFTVHLVCLKFLSQDSRSNDQFLARSNWPGQVELLPHMTWAISQTRAVYACNKELVPESTGRARDSVREEREVRNCIASLHGTGMGPLQKACDQLRNSSEAQLINERFGRTRFFLITAMKYWNVLYCFVWRVITWLFCLVFVFLSPLIY
jgi:hypothetical protein